MLWKLRRKNYTKFKEFMEAFARYTAHNWSELLSMLQEWNKGIAWRGSFQEQVLQRGRKWNLLDQLRADLWTGLASLLSQSTGQSSPGPGAELWGRDCAKVCFTGEVIRVTLYYSVLMLDFRGLWWHAMECSLCISIGSFERFLGRIMMMIWAKKKKVLY